MNTHREAIMAKRKQAHADNAGRITRGLMQRLRGAFRLDESTNQRTNTEAKSMGLPHQGVREHRRRIIQQAVVVSREEFYGRP
jgi:hypothetical protein